MSWRTDLLDRLEADTALSAALGERIGWFEAQRGWQAFPQLVLQEISPGREYTHGGPDGLDEPRVQFDIYATDTADIETVEAALLAEMEQDGVTVGDTLFGIGRVDGRRTRQPEDLADQTRVFGLQIDFIFHWNSTT